jgi:hypothetical protein
VLFDTGRCLVRGAGGEEIVDPRAIKPADLTPASTNVKVRSRPKRR